MSKLIRITLAAVFCALAGTVAIAQVAPAPVPAVRPSATCVDFKSLDGTLTFEATTTGDPKVCPNAKVSKVADMFIGFACAENQGVMPCATITPLEKPARDASIKTCSAGKMLPGLDELMDLSFEPWTSVWQVRGECADAPPKGIPVRTLKLGTNGLQICVTPGDACLNVGATTLQPNAISRLAELGWKGPIANMLKGLLESVNPAPEKKAEKT
jgi:hypothetical protein